MTTETHVVEACRTCATKVRVLKEKVGLAKCPQCKGPLGDPTVDHPCGGCGALNRVVRSRMAQARCGRCKEPFFAEGEVPAAYWLAAGQALVHDLFADARLTGRLARPRDLVEVIDVFKAMPQAIAELAANLPAGEDRDKLSSLSARCKRLAETLRPLAFESPAVLLSEAFVEQFQLADAFVAMRAHPAGFEALKAIRRSDASLTAARAELAPAGHLFERLLNRLHKTDWDDMEADRARRAALADQLFAELTRVVESWLPRPYKLEAMAKVAMTRMGELPGGEAAIGQHEALLREDVTAFLAIATTVVARGVAYHQLGETPKAVWPTLAPHLRGTALTSA